MKKSKLISILICAVMLAQSNAALAKAFAAPYSYDRLYAASARADVSHEAKKTILVSRGLISEELASDDAKAITYSDAAYTCAVIIIKSAEAAKNLTDKDKLDLLISSGIVDETKPDIDMNAEIDSGTFVGMCTAAAGYNILSPDEANAAKKLLTGTLNEKDKLTVKSFIDILHAAVNLPMCVVESYEYDAKTNTQIPHTVILDGSSYTDENGKMQQRDHVTILSEIESSTAAPEISEIPTPTEKPLLSDSERIAELQRLGIIAQADDLRLSDGITRAEISKILAVMLGEGESVQSTDNVIFNDVPAEHWAFNYIETLYLLSVINGTAPDIFEPNGNITYAQMCKLLVCAAGYNTYAEATGGYPDGYIKEATALDINNGISCTQNDELTREQTMIMAYNTLDIPLCVMDGYELDETTNTYTQKLVISDGTNGYELDTLRLRLEEE